MEMTRKKAFSVLRLKVGNNKFTLSDFSSLPNKDNFLPPTNKDNPHDTVVKQTPLLDKFISLYFEEGGALPRPETVYNIETNIDEENPRNKKQIERNTQTFVLIEERTQKIYLSNLKKKKEVEDWLKKKLSKNIIIKNIIDQEKFIDEIEQLNTIWLATSPDIFSSTGILGEELTRDIHNFGISIKHLGVSIKFEGNRFPKKAMQKLKQLLSKNQRSPLEKLEISGRVDDKFERIFNIDSIVDKIEIEVAPEKTGLFNKDNVFKKLINKIQ